MIWSMFPRTEHRPGTAGAPAEPTSGGSMTSATGKVSEQHELEGFIKDEVFRMYEEVAKHPEKEFHFFHGRKAADMFGYETEWLDR